LLRQWRLIEEQVPPLYARLPRQIVHGDFDPSNVLFAADRVSGVLDFEFSGPDLRVVDLLVPLNWWPLHQFGTGAEWPIMDAIGRGYLANLPLLMEELQALPALFRLRAIGGLLHRMVRYRQGLMTTEQLLGRVAFTQERVRWLRQHERRLLTMAGRWRQEAS
jgi:homoserine kinase type II